MRPALRRLRLGIWLLRRRILVHERHHLWPLLFLHPQTKVRSRPALKRHRRITRQRADSSRKSAAFLPRCSASLPLPCPGGRAGRQSFLLSRHLYLSFFGLSVSNRMLQTARKEEKMRRVWTLVSLLAMLGSAAWAQIPTKGNVFFGYSYDRTSIVSNDTASLNGWELTLEGKFLPWIGLVADLDGHYGNHSFGGTSADVTAHDVLFGPRVSVEYHRFRPFAEFVVGAGHISRSNGISDSDTSFVNGVGGGLDYRIFGPVTLRGQLDWINT